MSRKDRFFTFLEKRANLVILLSIPVLAFVYWLYFGGLEINYAELLVAHVFFCGFYSLAITLLITPVSYFFQDGFWYGGFQLLVQLIYLSWAYW